MEKDEDKQKEAWIGPLTKQTSFHYIRQRALT